MNLQTQQRIPHPCKSTGCCATLIIGLRYSHNKKLPDSNSFALLHETHTIMIMHSTYIATCLAIIAGVVAGSDYSATIHAFMPPPVVAAGVSTPVRFNYSASSCSLPFSRDRGCDWPYFVPWLVADPGYEGHNGGIFLESRMCMPSLLGP